MGPRRSRYVDEGRELRGTAGALRLALDEGVLDERFLVLYGDSWLQVDPAAVLRRRRARPGCPALMTVFANNGQFDTSNVEYADGPRDPLREGAATRPRRRCAGSTTACRCSRRELIADRVPPATVADLAPLCTALAAEGALAGFLVADRFYEIGSPDGLAEAETLLRAR